MNISCAGLKLDRQWYAAIGMIEQPPAKAGGLV